MEETRQYIYTSTPCTNTVHAMFQASTYVIVSNGRNTRFWTDCRMDDRSPADVVPTVLQAVQYSPISIANSGLSNCTVHDDLQNNRWIQYIVGALSAQAMTAFLQLAESIPHFQVSERRKMKLL